MANIHVLAGQGDNTYTAVLHIAVPNQNNSVGVNLRTAFANSGLNTSIMVIGAGPGQISSAEMNSIVSGSLYETTFIFGNNADWTPAERLAAFNAEVAARTASAQTFLINSLAFFGFTQ